MGFVGLVDGLSGPVGGLAGFFYYFILLTEASSPTASVNLDLP